MPSSETAEGAVLAVDPAAQAESPRGASCTLPELGPTLPGPSAAKRAEAVRAIDEGRHADARALLTEVLRDHPGNAASLALHAGLGEAVEVARRDASSAIEKVRRFTLAPPPTLDHHVLRAVSGVPRGPAPALGGMRMKANKIVDDEAWFAEHGLRLPDVGTPEAIRGVVIPSALAGVRSSRVLDHGDHLVLSYGDRFVVVVAEGGAVIGVVDTFALTRLGGMTQLVRWAEARDGVLYLSNTNMGYAKNAGGHNAYLSAIDLGTGELLWHSEPLVSNSRNFVLHGGYILSGYGFTAEPDHLVVLARDTGQVVAKRALPTKPDVLLPKDGKLHVRGYDKDFTFDLPPAPKAPSSSVAGRVPATGVTLAASAFAQPLEPTTQDRCLRDAAVIHLDHARGPGEHIDEAASALWQLDRRTKRSEVIAALREVVVDVQGGRRWLVQGPVHRPPKPPSQHATPGKHPPLPESDPPRLVQRSATKNQITDRRQWLVEHGNDFPERPRVPEDAQRSVGRFAVPGAPVPQVPPRYGLETVSQVIAHQDHFALAYGGRFVVIVDRDGSHWTSLDLAPFVEPAVISSPEWAEFGSQEVTWSQRADGVLYVCNGGGSYAKEVGGKKGFVSALSREGTLLWRSAPLVCNTNFVLRGRYLITGYGFTAEPDNLFVLDRETGETVGRHPLASAPDVLVLAGDTLKVRTYDTDYLFDLR